MRTSSSLVGLCCDVRPATMQTSPIFLTVSQRTLAVPNSPSVGIDRVYDASANGLRQQGHWPSYPLTSAENAVGCGRVRACVAPQLSRPAHQSRWRGPQLQRGGINPPLPQQDFDFADRIVFVMSDPSPTTAGAAVVWCRTHDRRITPCPMIPLSAPTAMIR